MKLFRHALDIRQEANLDQAVVYINDPQGTNKRLSKRNLIIFNSGCCESYNTILLKMLAEEFGELNGTNEYIAYDANFSPIVIANYINSEYEQLVEHPNLQIIRQQGTAQCEVINGTSYYMGILFQHYGHFIVETLSRFWRALELGLDTSNVKFVFHLLAMHGDGEKLKKRIFSGYWSEYFASLGINRNNFLFVTKPTLFEHLIIPQLAASLGRECILSSKAVTFWRHLNKQLICSTPAEYSIEGRLKFNEKVYISRRKMTNPFGGRRIDNEDEIEFLFQSCGFKIVFPEILSIAEQHMIFSRCKVLAGMPGSGMLNGIFLAPGSSIMLLVSQQMNYRNPGILHTISANHMMGNKVYIYVNYDYDKSNDALVGSFDILKLKQCICDFDFEET